MSTSVKKSVTDLNYANTLRNEDLFLVSQYEENNIYESKKTSLSALNGSSYVYVTSNISIDIDKILSGQGNNIFVKLSTDLSELSNTLIQNYAISDEIYNVLSSKNTDLTYDWDRNRIYIECDGNRLGSGIDAFPLIVSCDGDSIVSEQEESEEYKKSNLRVSENWLSTKCLIKGHMAQQVDIDKELEIASIKIDENGNITLDKRAKELSVMGGGGVLDGTIGSVTIIPINQNDSSIEYQVSSDCYLGIELSVHGNTNDSTKTEIYAKQTDGTLNFLNRIDAQQVFDNIEYINYQNPGFPIANGTTIVVKRQDNTPFPYHIDYPSSITFREYKLKGCLTVNDLSNYVSKSDYVFDKSLTGVSEYCTKVISKIHLGQGDNQKYIEQKEITDVSQNYHGLMTPSMLTKLNGIEDGANKYTLTKANTESLGGLKTGYEQKEKNYPVQLDDEDKAYVNVPWEKGQDISIDDVINKIYPINSIYITLDKRNPSEILGVGTWERMAEGKCLWGSTDGSDVGNTLTAGLPNITGSFSVVKAYVEGGEKAFSTSSEKTDTGGGQGKGNHKVSFSASNSNAIYGKSDTVQPPAVVVNMWKRTS